VQAQIRAESPRYAALTQPQPLSLTEIQQQVLDKGSLLLEYALGPIESYLWVVSADSITSYVLPKRKEINEQARQVYKLLTARNEYKRMETDEQRRARIQQADAQYPQAAAKLSEMILAPAASLLAHKRLIIVADGALQYIPFAALPSPLKTKKYEPLVARNEIVNLPSASTIAILRREMQGRKASAKTLAVIADPVFSDSDERVKNITIKPASGQATRALTGEDTRLLLRLDDDDSPAAEKVMRRINRLPFTRQEANDITNLVPKEETLELLDFDANRDRATNPEMGNYRYVHFASHGYINTEQPQLSAIILSLVDKDGKPQPQGGFLRTIDLYNLNLPVDMVVLSACETGLGKEVKGEGLVGFTRGFMYAGAPRVVVSLWSVSDRATAKLMERFYKRMLKKEMTPAAALRAAQKRMLDEKKWAAPYYWAAFVLQGEWH
jgi:CHAT domain-containing protein